MKKIFTSLFFCSIAFFLHAQQSAGGHPAGFSKHGFNTEIAKFKLSPIDDHQLLEEDAINAANGEKSLRFGLPVTVSISPETHGSWTTLDETRVWRLMILSENARSINLIFDQFDIPEGAKLFIYNEDGSQILGAYTEANENINGTFSTMPVSGERIIIEYSEPISSAIPAHLHLSRVIHGYRNFWTAAKDFGESGSCNNNVECPVGDPWAAQIRSSVMLLTADNSRFCSGSAINNTLNDGTPYILTANHCQAASTNIFMFNYKSPTCNPNQDGSTTDILQGCTVRASNPGSDFCLVELNDEIPPDYLVFFSGWSRQNTSPAMATCIHHPAGDVEKISFNTNATGIDDFDNADCWHIFNWEDGTTEGGSSGSPLYNENKQIIGQLYGGAASCNNNVDDYFGRFVTSWNGNSAATRLKDWLDPNNSNVTAIDGAEAAGPQFALNARILSVEAPAGTYCNTTSLLPNVRIKNRGSSPLSSLIINYRIGTGPVQHFTWSGTLTTSQAENVSLPAVTFPAGENLLFNVWSSSPNGQQDQDLSDDTIQVTFNSHVGAEYKLRILSDLYPAETSWIIVNTADNSIVESLLAGQLAAGLSVKELCMAVGCYKFIIQDSEGDGICCQYGSGSFTLFNPSGTILQSGGQFEDNDTVDFCVTGVSINDINVSETFSVFPNPAADQLNISIQVDRAEAELFSGTGQLLKKVSITGSAAVIPTAEFSAGVYFLRITTADGTFTRKVIIQR